NRHSGSTRSRERPPRQRPRAIQRRAQPSRPSSPRLPSALAVDGPSCRPNQARSLAADGAGGAAGRQHGHATAPEGRRAAAFSTGGKEGVDARGKGSPSDESKRVDQGSEPAV